MKLICCLGVAMILFLTILLTFARYEINCQRFHENMMQAPLAQPPVGVLSMVPGALQMQQIRKVECPPGYIWDHNGFECVETTPAALKRAGLI
jgi:hypothetical protein